MQQDLRKRRDETFEMLVVKGYDYRRVVSTLSDRYDVKPKTVEKDISRMSDWLPHLSHYDDDNGAGRMRELQKNRQRLHQMATEARQEDDTRLELRIRRQIDAAVETEVELAQSLGEMNEEPDETNVNLSTEEQFANLVGAASEVDVKTDE